MEALPNKADPAVNGGPVSLPAQGAVMHGIRYAGPSCLQTAAGPQA